MDVDAVGVGAAAMRSTVDDVDSLCLVKEYKELEEICGVMYVDQLLGDAVSVKEMKKSMVHVCDRARRIEKCASRAPLVAHIARNGGWLRLWDWLLTTATATHTGFRTS